MFLSGRCGRPRVSFRPRVEALEERTLLNNGTPDTSFGNGGMVTTDFAGGENQAFGLAVQPDGKLVAAGYAEVGAGDDIALARYNPDGSPDGGFGSGGQVTTDFGSTGNTARAVVVQPGGKILVGGDAELGGIDGFVLARYDSAGKLDHGFGVDGIITTNFAGGPDLAASVLLQTDGKIVATGSATVDGHKDFALARYDPDRPQFPVIDPNKITNPGPISIDPPDPPPLRDLTPQMQITYGKPLTNPVTGRYRQKVILRNLGPTALPGPLTLVLQGLRRKVRLHGIPAGFRSRTGISLPGGTLDLLPAVLAPGASLTVVLLFDNPFHRPVRYALRVLAGGEMG
jgi:uncharacterized delta-60 repeat protein